MPDRGHPGEPHSILIEPTKSSKHPRFKFSIFTKYGDLIDYSFAGSMWQIMRLAKRSWNDAYKRAKEEGTLESDRS